jgi:uncharacterized protein YegJ (DUF2314 family)
MVASNTIMPLATAAVQADATGSEEQPCCAGSRFGYNRPGVWLQKKGMEAMCRSLMFAVVLFGILPGCGKKQPEDKVTMVEDDDPRMNAAIDKARATVKTFISALKSPRTGQSAFSVKMAFTDGKQTEHMWLSPVSYDGKVFQGTVNNDPQMVSNVKIGQKASIDPSRISDWMYIEKRKLVGGYTFRVLREAMRPEERADFDRSMPFVID